MNVGFVAEAIVKLLHPRVQGLLPGEHGRAAALLAALHDVGKITVGFQAKCPSWLTSTVLPPCPPGALALSVSDHAYVSQAFLQKPGLFQLHPLWAVAVGAHHGRPKGRTARLTHPKLEALTEWAGQHRKELADELGQVFGCMPSTPPAPALAPYHSDLWLLAGLITVADWIGSNETWFSPKQGQEPAKARAQADAALSEIGWPGGGIRQTTFAEAFGTASGPEFKPNSLQLVVTAAAQRPGVIIVEGPMGCGKTEAALSAAQQLIASGHQQGIYFALPTQVTSNRVHQRVEKFLRNTLATGASLRLAHGNAWLEDDYVMRLASAFPAWQQQDGENPEDHVREARSWFASAKQALIAPYGVGTIDQALQAVVAVKHFFVRRFALAGKVVILDEIHSYDIYTGTLITELIRELVNLQCTVIILSATLTAARRRELLNAAGIPEQVQAKGYPLITQGQTGSESTSVAPSEWPQRTPIALRSVIIPEEEVVEELVRRAEAGQHVLWIRNTVVEAQAAFRLVMSNMREGSVKVGLLHSRFPFIRRAELENDWLESLGKNRSTEGPGSILIATQVVEQSVDIDLDFIVSDLAPTDMLLQRVGRLWRHERPHRMAANPEFWIRLPEVPRTEESKELTKALGRSSRVYAPYVLLRTLKVWQARSELLLPADIRPLLEATYAEPDDDEPRAWRELHNTLEKEKEELKAVATAATNVLGNRMLEDAEEILTRRKGPPTVPVVLLASLTTSTEGHVTAEAPDGLRMEISDYEWRKSSARFLHRWTVRAPRWMVPANPPRPRWLALHGPRGCTFATLSDSQECDFGGEASAMMYDPRLGIFARQPVKPTQHWKEDDDEFDN